MERRTLVSPRLCGPTLAEVAEEVRMEADFSLGFIAALLAELVESSSGQIQKVGLAGGGEIYLGETVLERDAPLLQRQPNELGIKNKIRLKIP